MHYPAERKEAILKKRVIAKSGGWRSGHIPATTLYSWRKQAIARGQSLPSCHYQPPKPPPMSLSKLSWLKLSWLKLSSMLDIASLAASEP